jgi:AcrR family transcriptional regulator
VTGRKKAAADSGAAPASVWLAPATPGRRGAGSGAGTLSREKTVATAVRLLDADGEDGLSMRKLAVELGVTPMSVYWYVSNKDDLLEFALDAVAGEIELPDPHEGPWTDALRALAHGWRRTMLAHPWALHCYSRYLNIGPHSRRIAECGLAITARAPLLPDERSGLLAIVFEYAYGATAVEARWAQQARQLGRSTDDLLAGLAESLPDAADGGSGGMLRRSAAAGGIAGVRDADFDRGLRWLIAGVTAADPA